MASRRNMTKKPLNPEKAKKLRPLRICLAILVAILLVLIIDRLPTSVKDRPSNQEQSENSQRAPEGYKYYYFNGFMNLLENQTEERMEELGVPEEDYEKFYTYLPQEELAELGAKVVLALEIDDNYVEANDEGVKEIRKIFKLSDEYSFSRFKQTDIVPTEYKTLSTLLKDYYNTLDPDADDE